MTDDDRKTIEAAGAYAVIFTARRSADDEGYAETAQRMLSLAAQQPGFLGVESVRDDQGRGITVSYWRDRASIAAWRNHAEHTQARAQGRSRWYRDFSIRICKIEKEYKFP